MGILAIVLLAIWLIGIIVSAASVAYTVQNEGDSIPSDVRAAMDMYPVVFGIFLTIFVVFWPATLIYRLTTGKK